jgi:hypothetical protein
MTLTSTHAAADNPVADWLLPTRGETRLRLERVVMQTKATDARRARPLRALGDAARRALLDEVETKLRTVLGETLVGLILGGWRKHAAIEAARRKSLSERGIDQIVSLCNHSVTARREHSVDIAIDSVRVMTLSTHLLVRTQLCDATAAVRDGHVVAIRSGNAKADGTVTVDGVQVAQRSLTFPLTVDLALRSTHTPSFCR